jgi:hypothetical protein
MTSRKKSESVGAQNKLADGSVFMALLENHHDLRDAARIDQINPCPHQLLTTQPTSTADNLYSTAGFI